MITLPLGLLLTGVLGWWLTLRSLSPIANITATARRISVSTSSESISLSGTGDELDLLAMTLNEMLGRIQDGVMQVRNFASNVAHQLRTPLSVLRIRLEVTLQQERTPDEYRRVLKQAIAEIDSLAKEVSGMLEFSRAEAGLDPEKNRPVSVAVELASIAEFFTPLAEQKGVVLRFESNSDAVVMGEPIWLRDLLANLIDNAVKYTPSGGSVSVELTRCEDWVVVEVRDTGIGISPGDAERIFERFERGPQHGLGSGAGLGLPLAREIARAHGGTIDAESIPGAGARFIVRLPAAESCTT